MTDDKTTGDKTLHAPTKTLSLKRPVEQGVVRQSFSHGRTKAVVVEKVKRRTLGPGEAKTEVKVEAPAPVAPPVEAAKPAGRAGSGRFNQARSESAVAQTAARGGSGVVLRTLTDDERDARAVALVEARKREVEERAQAEIEAKARAERDERARKEREAAAARQKEEDDRHRREDELRRKSEEAAQKRLGDAPASADTLAPKKPVLRAPSKDAAPSTTPPRRGPPSPLPAGTGRARLDEDEEAKMVRRPGGGARPAIAPKPERTRTGDDKRRGRLTVSAATSGEDEERTRSLASFRRRVQRLKGHAADEPKEKISREVVVPETITI